MQSELARATASLTKSEPAPYYLSYTVNDQDVAVLIGSYGSLLTDAGLRRRQADVTMRVGSPALDDVVGVDDLDRQPMHVHVLGRVEVRAQRDVAAGANPHRARQLSG